MTSRDHFDHLAAGIASLEPRDPERVAANEHARGCGRCAKALREAEQLMELIDSVPAPALSQEALRRLSERVTRVTVVQSSSSAWLVLAAALLTSLLLALATGAGGGGLDLLVGLHCAFVELVAAAIPYGVLLYSVVRGRRAGSAPSFAATAAAGALAGQLYLLLRCPDRTHMAHLLVTHTGAVALAALVGWIGFASLPKRAGATR
ncbi:MAG TPA: hypothetical protein VF765_02965 [Polyangiaceae bacterium]